MPFFDFMTVGLVQGLLLAVVAYGVLIPFRFLNFPDLSVEGTYPLGAACCAALLLAGAPPALALLVAMGAAALAGMATGVITLKLKVHSLLAGIIVSVCLYTIILRILGQPNVALFHVKHFFQDLSPFLRSGVVFGVLMLIIGCLGLFFQTPLGLRLRAVGYNPDFCRHHGISLTSHTLGGLAAAHGLSGLGGALMVQSQNYVDAGMGVGTVIHALAALMIGEALLQPLTPNKQLYAPLLGALVYQQIQGAALTMGLAPSDLKLLTGVMVLGLLSLRR